MSALIGDRYLVLQDRFAASDRSHSVSCISRLKRSFNDSSPVSAPCSHRHPDHVQVCLPCMPPICSWLTGVSPECPAQDLLPLYLLDVVQAPAVLGSRQPCHKQQSLHLRCASHLENSELLIVSKTQLRNWTCFVKPETLDMSLTEVCSADNQQKNVIETAEIGAGLLAKSWSFLDR